MTGWIILSLYWIASCVLIYASIYWNNKESFKRIMKERLKTWEHVLIVLLCPLATPILLVFLPYKGCQNLYYKNRPKPIPKSKRKFVRKDCVLDENNTIISIPEYNYKHGTEYTLDDVYGKGYTESLSEELKVRITEESTKFGVLDIQDNIPITPFTNAAIALGNALLSGDFADYEELLAEDATHVSYQKETISGKSEIIEYWKGWRSRYVETKKCKKFEVVFSNYYSNACLVLDMMVVMFLFRDNMIQKVLLIQRHLSPTIGFHEDILEPQFDLNSIKRCLSELKQPNEIKGPLVKENRIPCLTCGTPSEQLEWHSSLLEFGDIAYSGDVSICPHCHKVVEYNPEMRIRYEKPVDPRKEKKLIPHRSKVSPYNPKLFGLRNFEGGNPLKGTKYLDNLLGDTRRAAEEPNWFLYFKMSSEEFAKVRESHLAAIADGVNEAANNLAVSIFAHNYAGHEQEVESLLERAVEGGSHYGMLNLFTLLWSDKRYQEAVDLLIQIKDSPSPSLKCLWNLAFFYFMGADYGHNPIREKSIDKAKMILNEIIQKENEEQYIEEQKVFGIARNFLDYIESGNIFSSKAAEYHWRLRTNQDSLKAKGDDAVLWDLDSLSLDEGFHLGGHLAEQKGMGDESYFYVFGENGMEDNDILKYVNVDETPMGAWEIYLLMTSSTVLPTYWHGGYKERKFILYRDSIYEDDIMSIQALNTSDLSLLLAQEKLLLPSVDVKYGTKVMTADIYCCYWNEWEGLVREHIQMQIRNGKVVSYENKGKFVIYKYDCGIFF